MTDVRLAVAGVGLIGRRHVEAIGRAAGVSLAAVVDPDDTVRRVADVPWFPTLGELPAVDGVILATPNAAHVDGGLTCVARGIPVLVEKPLATDVAGARRLVEVAEAHEVPVLVGHHRRHNPRITTAKAVVDSGEIGRVVAVQAMFWLCKPDDYFEVEWRRRPGAGPVFINLIHDVDLLRHLVGEITAVQAITAATVRGFDVEDTAAILFEFASGAVGTANVSDAIPAPWSWELTSGENPAYPRTDEACYLIGGDRGSLELPGLRVWSHAGTGGWYDPIDSRQMAVEEADPLVRQIEHFAAVIRGDATPVVSGREGLRTLQVIEAITTSARDQERVIVGA